MRRWLMRRRLARSSAFRWFVLVEINRRSRILREEFNRQVFGEGPPREMTGLSSIIGD